MCSDYLLNLFAVKLQSSQINRHNLIKNRALVCSGQCSLFSVQRERSRGSLLALQKYNIFGAFFLWSRRTPNPFLMVRIDIR